MSPEEALTRELNYAGNLFDVELANVINYALKIQGAWSSGNTKENHHFLEELRISAQRMCDLHSDICNIQRLRFVLDSLKKE